MKSNVSPIDQCVGSRLREMRERMHFTQAFLATTAGTTVEQIELYERGLERVGAERLHKFARAFCVSPAYFFEQWENRPAGERKRPSEERQPIAGHENVFEFRGRNESSHSSHLRGRHPNSKKE